MYIRYIPDISMGTGLCWNYPPYQHYIGDRADYDVASCILDPDSTWFVRLLLFFTCTVCPLNATRGSYNSYSEDMSLDLVFLSALRIFT